MSALTISKTLRTIRRSITMTIFVLIIADSSRIYLVYPHSPNVLLLLLGITVVPRKIEDNAYAIFFFLGGGGVGGGRGSGGEGVNEVHYGQNGKLKTFDVPASTRLQIKKIISSIVLGNVKMVNSNFKTLFSVPRISAPLA